MNKESVLTGLLIAGLFWGVLLVVRWFLVNGAKEVIAFYFQKRMGFLEEMEKKFDGASEEVARRAFN